MIHKVKVIYEMMLSYDYNRKLLYGKIADATVAHDIFVELLADSLIKHYKPPELQ